ncbi:nucleoside-diphosphate kinase [Clostridium psychrophilum]|uniref:nucleoside-diphosphate kinase n=1 Tax=Clostridium psychrophilum TaxID=132926 RepID=UPI001C0BF433|nr:nucleoside-diphosphate kinase [Clostridium psychrophilum]MBU3181525.1 nucleoside-diphosphate kinase [Clostridium psychrophilum]
MERTLVLIKPDGVKRGLIGRIINRYEEKALVIVEFKILTATRAEAEKHYSEHAEKPYFEELISYISKGKICAMVLSGNRAIDVVRKINGDKDPVKAELSSIRGRFAIDKTQNLVHASDCVESAEREIAIWFPKFNEEHSDPEVNNLFSRVDNPPMDV